MNLIGRTNVILSDIAASFPKPRSAAARDIAGLSNNITFFHLAGLIALLAVVALTTAIARNVTLNLSVVGIHVSSGAITAALLLILLICVWLVLVQNWRKENSLPPGLPGPHQLVITSLTSLKQAAKQTHPGITDALNDVERVMNQAFGSSDAPRIRSLISLLLTRFIRSSECREIASTAPNFAACIKQLEEALLACLASLKAAEPAANSS